MLYSWTLVMQMVGENEIANDLWWQRPNQWIGAMTHEGGKDKDKDKDKDNDKDKDILRTPP